VTTEHESKFAVEAAVVVVDSTGAVVVDPTAVAVVDAADEVVLDAALDDLDEDEHAARVTTAATARTVLTVPGGGLVSPLHRVAGHRSAEAYCEMSTLAVRLRAGCVTALRVRRVADDHRSVRG